MNKEKVTFNVKYEIVLYTPAFNAWCPPSPYVGIFSVNFSEIFGKKVLNVLQASLYGPIKLDQIGLERSAT